MIAGVSFFSSDKHDNIIELETIETPQKKLEELFRVAMDNYVLIKERMDDLEACGRKLSQEEQEEYEDLRDRVYPEVDETYKLLQSDFKMLLESGQLESVTPKQQLSK